MDAVSERSSDRAPITVVAAVTGLGTTGGKHETDPGVRVQPVRVTEGEGAVGRAVDEMSGGLTPARSS